MTIAGLGAVANGWHQVLALEAAADARINTYEVFKVKIQLLLVNTNQLVFSMICRRA